MRFIDIFKGKECTEIYEGINEFVSSLLKTYNDNIKSLGFVSKPKDIFDFVWGTVELNEVEICLIDSPLVQRLRNIQQLGFASYVYCNADYSRFAHTIGVAEVAGRIAKMIEKNLKEKISNNDTFNMVEIVKLGAIFHDAGHMFLSHASEKFFTKNRNFLDTFGKNSDGTHKITNALTFFNEKISGRASFHEMISVMIVNSTEVKRFFNLTSAHLPKSKIVTDRDRDTLIEYISGLIVGTAIDKNILPFSMVIKGSIDADRLDYLSRDSATTKVPLAVDIARIINKITVVKLENYAPAEIWNDYSQDSQIYQSMAIKYSAQRLVWQFEKACEKVFTMIPAKNLTWAYIMSLSDAAMSEYFHYIIGNVKQRKSKNFKEAEEIILRIRDRNLYKRVASFSQDVLITSNYKYQIFVNTIIEDSFSDEYILFVDRLTKEYEDILKLKGKYMPRIPPVFMFIEANWQSESVADIPIDFGNSPYKMSSQIFKETPTIGEENKHKQYYLVTDQQDRDLVYLALERVMFLEYDMQIDESASTCAKFTLEQLDESKGKLFESNYYNRSLRLLSNKIFKRLYDKNMFDEVVKRYQEFSGVRESKITDESLLNYLKQFLYLDCNAIEIESLLDGVLRLLRNATFINRKYFKDNVDSLMNKIRSKGYAKSFIVKLGGVRDSANHLSYYFNDLRDKEKLLIAESVNDALDSVNGHDNNCIAFFDDGACSGKQVVSIFQELMGIPLENRVTSENHIKELDSESKKKLKSSNIILAYICFNSESQEYVLEELGKLDIRKVTILYEKDLCIKAFDPQAKIFISQKQLDLVKRYLSMIGYEVQKSSKIKKDGNFKERWDEDRCRNSSLGYNDAQQLVIFDFNVPTYTLTALWQNGMFNNCEWCGLFQRTDKS